MKPERINIAPPELGGDTSSTEQPWSAAFFISRTFTLAPSLQSSFLISVLSHARALPNPPKVTFVIDAVSPMDAVPRVDTASVVEYGSPLSLRVQWDDSGPMTEVELDFATWISGLHDHLVTFTELVN